MDHEPTPDDERPDAPILPPRPSPDTSTDAPDLPRLPDAGTAPSLPPSGTAAAPSLPSSSPAAPTPPPPDAAPAPSLPASNPTAPAPPASDEAAPFLPSAAPAAPTAAPAAQPVVFDAKAMVASQKHYTAEPTYGAMPTGTPEGREAARLLREQANRKKRRSKVVGRLFAVVVLAGIGVGGYFGYQAYQDSQDDDQVATGDDGTDADAGGAPTGEQPGAGLTPLGVIDEQLQAQDAVNSGTRTGVGGYLDAIDDARAVVDDINERGEGVTDLTETSILVDPNAPEASASRLDVVVTRFDLSTPDATVVQRFVADLATDTYVVVTGTDFEVLAAAETDAQTYYQYDAGSGTLVSAARGDSSRRPGPDGLFVAPFTPDVIYPPAVVLHSTATPIPLTTIDGTQLLTAGYVIDVTGFASVQPDASAAWLELIQQADPGRRPSIQAGTVATIDRVPADDLATITAEAAADMAFPGMVDVSAAPTPTADQAVIGWVVTDRGLVSHLYVHLGDGSAHWLYQVDDFDAPEFGPLLADAEPLG